ncbi:thrombospondin type-1 domain-containing protein 4-like [Hetaerina americana]|uniref:thrombospondin type-1 domain-containing protein 4-like n=1 Tax=Hetaerina americana TaxID=62018 RepID=UPI003A7F25E9
MTSRTAAMVLVLTGVVMEVVVGSVTGGGHVPGFPSGPERSPALGAPASDCRACLAGHPNFCRLVSGLFTRSQLPVGYNLIAQIPRSACNINITEMKHSRNFLSLRHSGGGAGILNGNWGMDWSGDYTAAGTTFTYHRHDPRGGPKAGESITAPGPTTAPVDLLLVVPNQNPNPGIKYQYFLPVTPKIAMSGAPVFANLPTGPQKVPSEYDGSNRLLPAGTNGRPSLMEAQGAGSHHYRGRKNRPPQRGSHLDHGLPFQPSNLVYHQPANNPSGHHFVWRVSEMTPCSKTCGGGKRRTVMSCVRETSSGSGSSSTAAHQPQENPAEGSTCDPNSPPQETVVRCNVKPCPAEWVAGDWGPCSISCGEGGTQTREIWCEQEISATLRMRVTEGACLSPHMPRTRRCPNPPVACHKRRWITSEWDECSVTCGEGVRRRNVHCTYPGDDDVDSAAENDSDDNEVLEEECPPEERPPEEEACDMGSCSKDTWFFTEWSSKCSSECGSGIRTRHVHCSGAGVNDIPGSGSCDPSTRPLESMACSSPAEDCPHGTGSWFAGPWSKCSTNINCLEEYKGSEFMASQTRDVVCITASDGKFEVVAEANCSSAEKPVSMRSCNHNNPRHSSYGEYEYEPLDAWNTNADADLFNSSLPHCAPEWYMTEWSQCSKTCSAGEQSREVKCLDRNQNPALGCSPQQRPSTKQECNIKPCSSGGHSHHHHHHRHPTKHSGVNCKDEYKNCALVVQARLCHYNYYRNACCHSCGLKS